VDRTLCWDPSNDFSTQIKHTLNLKQRFSNCVPRHFGVPQKFFVNIIHLAKILAFVATITAVNNYHGTNQIQENRFSTNQKAVIILAQ
jgi:hypothetical protein